MLNATGVKLHSFGYPTPKPPPGSSHEEKLVWSPRQSQNAGQVGHWVMQLDHQKADLETI